MRTYLILLTIYLYFSIAFAVLYLKRNVNRKLEDQNLGDIGESLLLTLLIELGKIEEAQQAAEVKFEEFHDVKSYSGFLTVNKNFHSNLFFWFFPAKVNYEKAPVVVWLQGGPGGSSMFGLFMENGPFNLTADGTLELSKYSWAEKHSMIYIDNPVGTGFSFTDAHGHAQNETAVGNAVYQGLLQFFTLFPELQNNEFFLSGESYAGKYVPAVAYTIHRNNPVNNLKINLKGLAIGNGLCDPKHQNVYADYLYQIGLIDFNIQASMKHLQKKIVRHLDHKHWLAAYNTYVDLINLFREVSGFENLYNFLEPKDVLRESETLLTSYLQRKDVKKAIHVGNINFTAQSDMVYNNLKIDFMQSVTPLISELLEHYRVLIYNGQLDIIVAYPLTENFLLHFQFNRADEYKKAPRHYWQVDDDIAGYAKYAGNLTEVLVRNAGHMVPSEQPKWALDLITRFIANKPLYQ
ncbi:hypothetical protein ILUMI_05708 [Ignelater luminosus]|uniref:Carboxypeptidase n=1 Tax=Ignelater luminosus TaxID=2038154 RepID=A0A8K0GJU8_IGNLU|nr:hypothetical protein ILUMI_05708 [Ignelater luminosus]